MKKIIMMMLVGCVCSLTGVEATQVPSEKKLLNAMISNDTFEMGNLLAKDNIDVNLRIDGMPIIALVAAQGHTDMAEVLWRTGKLNIEAKTEDYGHTALHIAVMNRRFDMVKWLVEHGADVNALDKNREPALYYTGKIPEVLQNEKDLVSVDKSSKVIVCEDVNENEIVSLYLTPSLYKYVGTDSSEKIAEYLKQNGADESKKKGDLSVFGFLPFEAATELGDTKMVSSMLADGLDLNEKIGDMSPIWHAVCFDQLDVVRMLLKNGANVSGVRWGQILLEQAILGEHVDMVRLLAHSAPETVGRGLLFAIKQCFCLHSENYYDVLDAVLDMASRRDVATVDNYGTPVIVVAGWDLYYAADRYERKTNDAVQINDRSFSASVQAIKRLIDKGASLNEGARGGTARDAIQATRDILQKDGKHPDWVSKLDELLNL